MLITLGIFAASVLGSYLLTSNWAANMGVACIASALASLVFMVELMRKGGKPGPVLLLATGAMGIALALHVVFTANYTIAQHRALSVANACEAYRADNKAYPRQLSELVPKYMANIPVAKYTLMYGQFHYDGHLVFFTSEPGMPMPAYSLAKKEWTSTRVYRDVK